MTKESRTLESFSPAVLAAWIRQEHPYFLKPMPVLEELERIEARQEWQKLQNEIRQLIEESGRLHGITNAKQWQAIQTSPKSNYRNFNGEILRRLHRQIVIFSSCRPLAVGSE
mgnify:CR=1 FL=1